MRESARRPLHDSRLSAMLAWLPLLAAVLTMALASASVRADDGTLELDPDGGGYTMRLGGAERVASGASGTVYQIPIQEPPGSSRDAPAVGKVLGMVPAVGEDAIRADVITRRDGTRVVQLVMSGSAVNVREVLLALYWHDGSFRRRYQLSDAVAARGEVRDPSLTNGAVTSTAGAPTVAASTPVAAPERPVVTSQVDTTGPRADSAPIEPARPMPPAGAGPVAGDAGPAAAGPAAAAPEQAGGAAERASPVAATRSGTELPTGAAGAAGREVVVRDGDSLWLIAERIALPEVTRHQLMMGIYEKNPEAFGGNVDSLRAGARLIVPERTELRYDPAGAVNAFLENSRLVPVARPDAAPDAPSAQGRAAASDGTAGARSAAGDQLEVGVDENDPALARERDTAYAMAMAEAQSRIEDLTKQVEQLETLIQLKDIQISEAQARLGESAIGQTSQSVGPAPGAAPAAASQAGAAGTLGGAVAGAGAEVTGAVDATRGAVEKLRSESAEVVSGVIPVAADVPADAGSDSPLLGGFNLPEGFWTFAAGIAIALVIVMIVLRLRRRREEVDDEEYDEDDFLFDDTDVEGGRTIDDEFEDSALGGGSWQPERDTRTTHA